VRRGIASENSRNGCWSVAIDSALRGVLDSGPKDRHAGSVWLPLSGIFREYDQQGSYDAVLDVAGNDLLRSASSNPLVIVGCSIPLSVSFEWTVL
jgi:hypothetical protein